MRERSDVRTNGGQATQERVRPIKVALVNDYEIILRGLHAMLAPFSDRIEVVEHDTTELCVVGSRSKPAIVHRRLRLLDGPAHRAKIRP